MSKFSKVGIAGLSVAVLCSLIPSLDLSGAAGVICFVASWIVGSVVLNRQWAVVPNAIKICHVGVTLILLGTLASVFVLLRTGDATFGIQTLISFVGYSLAAYGLYKAAQQRDATSNLGDVIDSIASSVIPLTIISTFAVPYIFEDSEYFARLDTILFFSVTIFLLPVMFLLIYGSGERSVGATWAASAGIFAVTVTSISILGESVGAAWLPEIVRFYAIGFVMYAIALYHPSLLSFASPGTRSQTYRWKLYAVVSVGLLLWGILTDPSGISEIVFYLGCAVFVISAVLRLRMANITNQRLTEINKVHSSLALSLAETDTIESSLLAGENSCRELLGKKYKFEIVQVNDELDIDYIDEFETRITSETGSTVIFIDKVIKSYQRVAVSQIANVVDFAVGSVEGRAEKASKIAEDDWRKLSLLDQVTDLRNQVDFEAHDLSESGGSLAVFYLSDVDRMEESHGREVSENLLKLFVSRCNQQIRADDLLWKGSGSKLILLSEYSPEDPTAWIEEKRKKLSEMIEVGSASLKPNIHAGIFVIDQKMEASSALLRAEMALSQARDLSTVGSTVMFDEQIEQTISRRWKIESGFAAAVKNPTAGGFAVHYQPIVDTVSTEVVAVEALARWTHPELGLVPPSEFIPAAERAGLVAAIDNFVLTTALNDLDTIRAAKVHLKIHINMSPVGLTPERIREAGNTVMLSRGSSENSGLVFEMIESAIGKQPIDELASAMRYVRDLGIGISIDDFGTGESNFDRLGKLPFTQVKLANQFVQSEDSLLIESMLRTVSHLRLDSVIEGVETKEQYEIVKAAGGNKIQGWYFVKAAPLAETIDYIIKRKVSESTITDIRVNR